MDFGKHTQPPNSDTRRKDYVDSKKKEQRLIRPRTSLLRTPISRLKITILALTVLVLLLITSNTHSWGEVEEEPIREGTFLKRKLDNSEMAYQEVVLKRKALLTSDVLELGPWEPPPDRKNYAFVWDYFPPAFSCPHTLSRIGALGDGGKWICGFELYDKDTMKNNEDSCILYSFGVGNKTSFEEEWMRRTDCDIYAHDGVGGTRKPHGPEGTIKSESTTTKSPKRKVLKDPGTGTVYFQKVYLSSEDSVKLVDNKTKTYKTLANLMNQYGHEWIDILKMDIGTSSYPVLNQILDEFDTLPFSQLQVEFHIGQDGKHFQDLVKLWDRLESRGLLRPFNFEMSLLVTVRAEQLKPGSAEYAFINMRDGVVRNRLISLQGL